MAAAVISQKEQGNRAFKAGRFRDAEQHYTAAIDACGGSADDTHLLHGNRAAAWLKLGDAAGALADADAALGLQARWDKGWYRKAAALEALGRVEEALAAAEASVQCARSGESGAAAKMVARLRRELTPAAAPTEQRQRAPAASAQPGQRRQEAQQQQIPQAAAVARAAVAGAAQNGGGALTASIASGATADAAGVAALLPAQLRPGHRFQHSKNGSDHNLLILLHGLGDTPESYAALAAQLALPHTASLALPGPLPLPAGLPGHAWFQAFDAAGQLLPRYPPEQQAAARAASLAATLELVEATLERLGNDGGWPCRRIHLLGFSQGGTVALHLAAVSCGDRTLGSCLAIAASLLPGARGAPEFSALAVHDPDRPEPAGQSKATPMLLTHGGKDDRVPHADVQRTVDLLNRRHGGSAQLETFPGKGHDVISSPAEARVCMGFWARHLSAPPPPAAPGEEVVEVAR